MGKRTMVELETPLIDNKIIAYYFDGKTALYGMRQTTLRGNRLEKTVFLCLSYQV
jgi:hypothetical protein